MRIGGKLFPEGATGRGGEREATVEETWRVAREWWEVELEIMEEWLKEQHTARGSSLDAKRPSLTEVLMKLQQIRNDPT